MSYPFDLAATIVAFHTDSAELEQLLRSLQQSSLCVLVTVVDNSSDQSLRAIVESTGATYIYPGRNLGFAAGNNVALSKTIELAPYQALVNPDITLTGEGAVLHELFDYMQANEDVGWVMPTVRYPDGSEQRLTKRLPTPFDLIVRRLLGGLGKRLLPELWGRYEMRDIDLSHGREVPSLSGCFMFLRSSVLQQVGLLDDRYFLYMEDVDLCRRVGRVSRTMFLPTSSLQHGYGKGSYKKLWLAFLHMRSAIQYFNKWGWMRDPERDERNRLT